MFSRKQLAHFARKGTTLWLYKGAAISICKNSYFFTWQ